MSSLAVYVFQMSHGVIVVDDVSIAGQSCLWDGGLELRGETVPGHQDK